MRFNAIKKLVDINILYAIQASQLQQYRKKQEKNPSVKVNVSQKTIRMYLILGFVYLVIFGIMSAFNHMVGNPGLLPIWSPYLLYFPCHRASWFSIMSFMKARICSPIGPMPLVNQKSLSERVSLLS